MSTPTPPTERAQKAHRALTLRATPQYPAPAADQYSFWRRCLAILFRVELPDRPPKEKPQSQAQTTQRIRPLWAVLVGASLPVAVATAVAVLVSAPVANNSSPSPGSTDWNSGGDTWPATESPSGSSPSAAPTSTPCAPQKPGTSHPALVSPCEGDVVAGPYPVVQVLVPDHLHLPSYGQGPGQSALWLLVRQLTDGHGEALPNPPIYAQKAVRPGTAAEIGSNTWSGDIQVFQTCHDFGLVELLLVQLDSAGAKTADQSWEPGRPIVLPVHTQTLDRATITIETGAC